MGNQRARKSDEIQMRYKEILAVAEQLFLTTNYDDITLVTIANKLSISRPSFYNYYKSKEELFLALMKQEYLSWKADLEIKLSQPVLREEFFDILVSSILSKKTMLKLLSLHSSALEKKCGYDIMYQFKKDVLPFFMTLTEIVERQFPNTDKSKITLFITHFNLLINTMHNYMSIPNDQIQVMQELKVFGEGPLPEPQALFTQMLALLGSNLEK